MPVDRVKVPMVSIPWLRLRLSKCRVLGLGLGFLWVGLPAMGLGLL